MLFRNQIQLHELRIGQVRVVELAKNRGKGAALRAGLAQGRGRYLGFIDGDGDVPPELLAEFVALVQQR